MTADPRELLADYAREVDDACRIVQVGDEMELIPAQRGELAGRAFVALQNVLNFLDAADDMELTRDGVAALKAEIRKAFE